jgi:hypothetical protein
MKKNKINVDRAKPSSEEILSRRNFDSLMQQYTAAAGTEVTVVHKPFWKSTWFLGSFAAVAAVTVFIVAITMKNEPQINSNTTVNPIANNANTRTPDSLTNRQTVLPKLQIAPPMPGLNVAIKTFKVNAKSGGVLEYASGSKIVVPANAFVDENGNPINGNVELQYREFRDQVDIFLSGIPMQYDSAGTRYAFESAGMFEIAAFVNGKVVKLKNDKPIEVQMTSSHSGPAYNMYRFDTDAANWVYLGKDQTKPCSDVQPEQVKAVLTPEEKQAVKELQTTRDQQINTAKESFAKSEEPVKPQIANRKKNRFTVDFSVKEFPEMSSYKEVLWEVDETSTPFDSKKMYGTEWESVTVSRGKIKGRYLLSFTKKGETVTYNAYPVFEGEKYDDAIKIFEEKYETYSQAVARRDQAMSEAQKTYEAGLAKSNLSPQLTRMDVAVKTNMLNQMVYHVFVIAGFGAYNCDRISNYPQEASIKASFWDEFGNPMKGNSIYLVDKDRASVYNYSGNPVAEFRFNPFDPNLIWTVQDGKLYSAGDEEIRQLPTTGEGQITLKEVKKTFASPDEMKQYFGIEPNSI